MEDDTASEYLIGLQTLEERRAATAVPHSELRAAVRALAGCQRCGFVEQVLAAFAPELVTAASAATLYSSNSAAEGHASPAPSHNAEMASDTQSAVPHVAAFGAEDPPAPTLATGGTPPCPTSSSSSVAAGAVGGLMSPVQLLALLSSNGGSTDLVGLLQFAWKDKGSGSATSDSHHGGACGRGGGCLSLSDTLLGKPRLLRRFLQESVATMQTLAEDVGDCRRHAGYPGPSELASTLSRLETQRCHTLERLAAWGVLRASPSLLLAGPGPDPNSSQGQGRGGEGEAHGSGGHGQDRVMPCLGGSGSEGCAVWVPASEPSGAMTVGPPASTDGDVGATSSGTAEEQLQGGGSGDIQEDSGEEEGSDPQLALAIRLSLGDAPGSPGPVSSIAAASAATATTATAAATSRTAGDVAALARRVAEASLGAMCPAAPTHPQPPQLLQARRGPVAGFQRRTQRTPPRPTGGAPVTDSGGCSGGRVPEHHSPARGALNTWPKTASPGCSPTRAAGCGLSLHHGPASTSTTVPPPAPPPSLLPPSLAPQPPTRRTSSASAPPAAQEPRSPAPTPDTATVPPHSGPRPPAACAPATSTAAATAMSEGAPAAASPLPVSAAVSAASGLDDASVLMDSGAVAALPLELRQRVEQLAAQLVQVQQRRGRLQHALQHGILAGGRKLLLILLQLMWASLRRAAAAAASTAVAADSEPAVTPPEAAATGDDGGDDDSVELGAPQQGSSSTGPVSASTSPGPPALPTRPQPLPQPLALLRVSASQAQPEQPQQALQPQPEQPQRRRARYEGLLADLAAGLGEDEMYLDILGPDLGSELELGSELGSGTEGLGLGFSLDLDLDLEAMGWGQSDLAGDRRGAVLGSDSAGDANVVDGADWLQEVLPTSPLEDTARRTLRQEQRQQQLGTLHSEPPHLRGRRTTPLGTRGSDGRTEQEEGAGGDRDGDDAAEREDGWDAALTSSIARPPVGGAAALRSSRQQQQQVQPGLVPATAAVPNLSTTLPGNSSRQRSAPSASVSLSASMPFLARAGPTGTATASAAWGTDRLGGAGWAQLERDAAEGCNAGCVAVRAEQAEQLRLLQGQLSRCQTSQAELQGEVGRLLDLVAQSRRVHEQASSSLRRELAQWQGDPGALAGLGAEELGELAGRMEAALSRVRAAQLQAAADRDLMCPVCWERRKGLVFGCGHQTCCACGERLSACPICRELITIRIRVYS